MLAFSSSSLVFRALLRTINWLKTGLDNLHGCLCQYPFDRCPGGLSTGFWYCMRTIKGVLHTRKPHKTQRFPVLAKHPEISMQTILNSCCKDATCVEAAMAKVSKKASD
eukprot:6492136-Amphidinium_carterae.4